MDPRQVRKELQEFESIMREWRRFKYTRTDKQAFITSLMSRITWLSGLVSDASCTAEKFLSWELRRSLCLRITRYPEQYEAIQAFLRCKEMPWTDTDALMLRAALKLLKDGK